MGFAKNALPICPRAAGNNYCINRFQVQKNHMTIKLSKEIEERLVGSIRRYFTKNMDDEIGELKAKLLLDFCVRELGPSIYNQAIADAQAYMQDKVVDLDVSCHEEEFDYWKKQ